MGYPYPDDWRCRVYHGFGTADNHHRAHLHDWRSEIFGSEQPHYRKLFLWLAVFLIGKGMLWGNVIGLAFYFIQKWFGLFRLDPETYYMDTVPVSFNLWLFLLLNVGTLLASIAMLLGPSYLITRIHPANSMRYE